MLPAAFRRQPEPAAAAAWFGSREGQALLASQAEALRAAVREQPGRPGLWLCPNPAGHDVRDGWLLRLHASAEGLGGDLRSGLQLPLASESCGVVVVQHLADICREPAALLDECARVLLPGGRLWLFALNPLSPYRLRWRGQGPRAAEPVAWRRRLRSAGLVPEPVSQGLGPTWTIAPDPACQDGAGLRAAFLLRAEKRRIPMTPIRSKARVRWQAEPAA